jgi:transcriptional regulator with XRE-family HTH domain
MREMLNMEAKHLALLTNIDAANISRIEQGRYSVGFDILSKIALAVGARIDLVK